METRSSLISAIRACSSDTKGGVAITFAFALVPMIAAAGAAVDFSRANSAKAALQAAADSTALAMSRTASSQTPAQINAAANDTFKALLSRKDIPVPVVTADYTSKGGSQITVKATAAVPTTFMNIMGIDSVPVSVTSTTAWGTTRLRVAMVLDVTGSMASANKLSTMQTAAKNLVDQLSAAATTNGDVYISLVAFAKDVNSGLSSSSSAIRWDLWDEVNGSCSKGYNISNRNDCLRQSGGPKWTADSHSKWNGCVTDRDEDYDISNAEPNGKPKQFPAEQYNSSDFGGNCPQPIVPLTYDWSKLKNTISALDASGGTNQAIGLQWGFQTLTASPFTVPPKDKDYDYEDIIILLSDGLNTQSRLYGNGRDWSRQIDDRQAKLCASVKGENITVYTIQVNTDGDPTSNVLKSCASASDKFFMLTKASQITATFDAIGTGLTRLRLAK